jgi:hypothetical protein
MAISPESTLRRREAFKLGWVRGIYGLEPRPRASEYPLDKRHQDFVKGYQAGLKRRSTRDPKEQLEHAWERADGSVSH